MFLSSFISYEIIFFCLFILFFSLIFISSNNIIILLIFNSTPVLLEILYSIFSIIFSCFVLLMNITLFSILKKLISTILSKQNFISSFSLFLFDSYVSIYLLIIS